MLQRFVRSMVSTDPRPCLIVLGAVLVELFVVVRANVAAGKDLFEVLEERRVIRHNVFEVAVFLTILDHQDFAVAFDDLRLNLADSLVQQNFVRKFAVDDLLANFRNALWAQ